MKKTKILGVAALAAVLGTTAVPVLAAPLTSNGTTEVTYTANSASPDGADWLISYPKKVVLSDFNKDAQSGVALDFKVLDKITSADYTGAKTVTVSVGQYTGAGYTMTGGTKGSATMHLADSKKVELTGANKVVDLSQAAVSGAGYAYLTASNDAEGTFTKNVTFTFTDNTQ